ncbi:MAG: hypothetical protein GY754_32645 [bacterium]|nr:hypothetical protein [bacterium]
MKKTVSLCMIISIFLFISCGRKQLHYNELAEKELAVLGPAEIETAYARLTAPLSYYLLKQKKQKKPAVLALKIEKVRVSMGIDPSIFYRVLMTDLYKKKIRFCTSRYMEKGLYYDAADSTLEPDYDLLVGLVRPEKTDAGKGLMYITLKLYDSKKQQKIWEDKQKIRVLPGTRQMTASLYEKIVDRYEEMEPPVLMRLESFLEEASDSLYESIKQKKPVSILTGKIRNRTADHIDTTMYLDVINQQLLGKKIQIYDFRDIRKSGKPEHPPYLLRGTIYNINYAFKNKTVRCFLITLRLDHISTEELVWVKQKSFITIEKRLVIKF